ncbi:hypothetical protein KIW84_012362 [Lathyrus oleraceus]|uniref:Uncharacterized protein n=1 Tax=Pisum sativum TaxID=3888 RepID=A0A9D5BHG4_PEA|nr:hypothetical protein KIW84_012362 [Pisum sativum]
MSSSSSDSSDHGESASRNNNKGSDIEASAPASHGLAFTPEQHQALLALLQGSSHLQSHTTNQLTSQTNLGSVS